MPQWTLRTETIEEASYMGVAYAGLTEEMVRHVVTDHLKLCSKPVSFRVFWPVVLTDQGELAYSQAIIEHWQQLLDRVASLVEEGWVVFAAPEVARLLARVVLKEDNRHDRRQLGKLLVGIQKQEFWKAEGVVDAKLLGFPRQTPGAEVPPVQLLWRKLLESQ
jgi:hypothetical protein